MHAGLTNLCVKGLDICFENAILYVDERLGAPLT